MVPRGFHGRGTGLAVVDSEERDQEQSTGGLQELGGWGGKQRKRKDSALGAPEGMQAC